MDDLGIFKLDIKEPEGIITTSSGKFVKETRKTYRTFTSFII